MPFHPEGRIALGRGLHRLQAALEELSQDEAFVADYVKAVRELVTERDRQMLLEIYRRNTRAIPQELILVGGAVDLESLAAEFAAAASADDAERAREAKPSGANGSGGHHP